MGYLDGLDNGDCPFCMKALDEYVSSESYAGRWVSIDVPTDLLIGEAVGAKEFLYRACKKFNMTTKGKVKFNLDSLR